VQHVFKYQKLAGAAGVKAANSRSAVECSAIEL